MSESSGINQSGQTNHGPQTNITGNIYGPIISGNIYFQNWDPNAIKHLAIDVETYLSEIEDEDFSRLLGEDFVGTPVNLFISPYVKNNSKKNDDDDDERIPLLKQIKDNRFVVLLGEPGSGKSTLVNHIAYCIAQKALNENIKSIKNYDDQTFSDFLYDDESLFPVVIKIRSLMAFVRDQNKNSTGHAEDLNEYIERIFNRRMLKILPYINSELHSGHLFLLLDGLDEIRPEESLFVRNVIREFCSTFHKIRVLVTCRTLNYVNSPLSSVFPRNHNPRSSGGIELEIGRFRSEQRDEFIDSWYQLLENTYKISQADSTISKGKIKRAIEKNIGLLRLASTPLLLTMMVVVHWKKKELPEARVLLYDAIIQYYLFELDNQKELGLQKGVINFQFIEKALGELAYHFHAENGYVDENNERGIRYADLEKTLLKWIKDKKKNLIKFNPDINDTTETVVREIVSTLKERSPLFINVGHSKDVQGTCDADESFTFPHRTFQEYLASLHLSPSYLDIPTIDKPSKPFYKQAIELIESDIKWHDVILLAVGRFRHILHEPEKSLVLTANLCPDINYSEDPNRQRKNWLAGDILRELERREIQDNDIGKSIFNRVRHSLKDLLLDDSLSIDERKRVGETLSELGDIRFSDEFWQLPQESCLGFIVILGKKREKIFDKSSKTYSNNFWVAKYPVTVAQYKLFDQNTKGIDNHPVRNITREQALSYCTWLNNQLMEKATEKLGSALPQTEEYELWNALATENYRVSLLSSDEWEKAASCDGKNEYPWTGEFDPDKANLAKGISSSIRSSTTTVGIFHPNPYGLYDMCGNVWEWTRSDKNGVYIIKGASYLTSEKDKAKCSYQADATTADGFETIGFRLAISKG